MEAALRQEAEDDAAEWGSKDSSDYNYPGAYHQRARCVNVGQLWDEHRTFFAALPAYLEYGGEGGDQEPTTVHTPGA